MLVVLEVNFRLTNGDRGRSNVAGFKRKLRPEGGNVPVVLKGALGEAAKRAPLPSGTSSIANQSF